MDNLVLGSSKIILFNLTDDLLLYEQSADVSTAVASLTKIMTAILTIEKRDLNEKVTITNDMLSGLEEFAILGLEPGQTLSVEELLYATMLPSAGDAAKALAISTAGSVEDFASIMNSKAQELGMTHTHFSNPVGFDKNNYSAAQDIAILLKYALKNEQFETVFDTFEYYMPSLGKTIIKTVRNDILTGAKTGFTYDAGRCLASTAHFSDADFLLVNLNADWQSEDHINDAVKIYNYYAENYSYRNVLNAGEKYWEMPVYDSATKSVEFFADADVKKYLKNDLEISNLERKYDGINEIHKGAKLGDYLGNYQILNEGTVIYEQPVYLTTEIKFYPYWLWNTGVVVGVIALIMLIIAARRHVRQGR